MQTRLYNNKIARLRAAGYSREDAVREAGHWVAVPGTSEHQTGLALDIVSASYQVLNKRQETTADGALLGVRLHPAVSVGQV